MISYFPVVTGSLTVSGSVNISGGITASGGISISGSIASASYAASASNALAAQTASYVLNAVSASYAASASNALSASNAVTAQTASFANALTVAGTLTAQTLVVQTITSSVDYVTGSTRFGSLISNTHTFTGSINATGSLHTILGQVVIGATASASVPLEIYDASAPRINLRNSSSMWATYLDSSNSSYYIRYGTGAVNIVTVTTGSNVGIGNTNPTAPLHVLTSSASTQNITAEFWNNDYTSGTRNFIRVRNNVNAGSTYSSYFGQGQDGKTYIVANDFTKTPFVIDSNSMVVSIGTTSSSLHSNSSGLIVAGTGGNRGIIEVWDSGATAGKAVFQNVGGITYVGSLSSGSGAGTLALLTGGNGGSANVAMSLSGSGTSVSIGRTDFGYPLNVASAFSKTDTTGRGLLFLGSNEAFSSNPFGIVFTMTGASTVANRYISIGTTDFGLVNAGNLVLQSSAGNVGIGTISPSDVLDVQKNQNAITNFYFRNTDTTNTNSRSFLNIVSGNTTLLLGTIHNDNAYVKPNTATALYLGYNNALKLSSGNNLEYVGGTPNANYNIATDGVKLTIASGGTIDFQFFSGLIVVNNHSNGVCAMWLVGAGNVSLIGQSSAGATGTMTYNGGITGYTWTSTYGSTAFYGVFAVKTRNNA